MKQPAGNEAASMKVRVRYFAGLRETLGKDSEEIELPPGVSTVAALRAHLKARGGAYEEVLSDKRLVKTAVNQDMVKPTAAVKPGDEVAFFPPVTGG
jgi:molybdopterin synthase sulfur carrier subunit